MGTKLSDLLADHPHTGAALASGDVLAVLDVSDTTEAATGTTKGITASELAIGVASVGAFATDAELAAHEADTTAVHGIADTSVLATATTLATAVSSHAAATDPHADRAYADTVGNLKLAKASNLSDLANAATARTNLGLAAIAASGSASDLSAGTVPSARLGTGGAGAGGKVLADNQTWITAPTGTIGGTLGAADNTVPRSDGVGAGTLQASALTVDDAGVPRIPTLGSELPSWSFTDAQDANNVRVGMTAFGGNLYTIVNSAGVAMRTINITSTATTGAVGGWVLSNTAASATVPIFQPDFGDSDTGIGRAGTDQLSLVAGGVEVLRLSEGVAGVSDGCTGPVAVEANTAGVGTPNVLIASESKRVFTNEGSTAENYHTLPSAAAGLAFTFIVQDADGIRIVAATGDTIRPGAVAASATAGFIRCATQGAAIALIAINSTEWMATSVIGTWTVDA